MKKALQKTRKPITAAFLLLPALLICFPVFLILTGSVMDSIELGQYLGPVFGSGEGFIRWKLMPDYPTFEHYGRLLFMTPSFFVLFWNSIKLVVCILAGQLLVGVPAAWAFAAYRVRGGRTLFALYVVLMLLIPMGRSFCRPCFPPFPSFYPTAGFARSRSSFWRLPVLTGLGNFLFSSE